MKIFDNDHTQYEYNNRTTVLFLLYLAVFPGYLFNNHVIIIIITNTVIINCGVSPNTYTNRLIDFHFAALNPVL